jgi:chromatin segregation and condensation protein Rec8/ScpA/Scc1 (kleisin family)
MIGVFLALLELIRQKKVVVSQPDDSGELEIDTAPPEHRKTANEAPEAAPVIASTPG